MDSTQVEVQPISLGIMTLEDIYKMFAVTVEELTPFLTETITESPDLVDELVKDRDMLVKEVFAYVKKDSVISPVHLKRVIEKYSNPYSTKTDLTPTYIVDELTKLMKEPWLAPNRVFHCLLRFYLAPRRSILEHRFTKAIFDEVIREVRFKYIKSQVHSGEMVGALAAQSVGEPITQLTLNTFHSAGTVKAGATQGVPRIQELLGISKSPKKPLNFVYLTSSDGDSFDRAIMVARDLQKTTVRDITRSVRMYYDPFPLTTETVVGEDREILQRFQQFSTANPVDCASKWIMRLEFDETEMAARNINDMVTIQDKMGQAGLHILQCVYTDSNSDKLVMRIVFPDDIVKNLMALRFLEERVLDVVLTGIDGVGRVIPREVNRELVWDDTVNGYISKKQHVLDVEGANLYDLLARDNVDPTRTFSNHIHEVYDVLGVEAARQALYDEFLEVFTESSVNYHHLSVLLDAMTYQGRLVSVNRFGMYMHDNGVLAKSSFEETSKILFNAAVSAEYDPMKGVSANIMFGQKPPCGTGFVDILLDETRLPEGTDEAYVDYRDQIKQKVDTAYAGDTECKMEDISMW